MQPCSVRHTDKYALGKHNHIGGLQTLRTLLDGELHLLLRFELAVTVHLQRGEVDEYILSAVAADEAVALGGIEPLDGASITFGHLTDSCKKNHPCEVW